MNNIKDRILLILDILRISFISLVPYYVLYSFVTLLVEVFRNFGFYNSSFTLETSYDIIKFLLGLLPILLNISISYHLGSVYYSINKFLTIILSLIIYFCVEIFTNQVSLSNYIFPQSIILAMIIPLSTTFLILKFVRLLKPYQKRLDNSLSSNISTMIIYIIPFTLVFLILTFVFSFLIINFDIGSNIILFEDGTLLIFFRTIVSSLFWLFGIHGINLFDTIINISVLDNSMFQNLTYKDFFNLFIVLGGSGAGVSLVLAIVFASKDKHTTFIGKISLPFVIFNINEILVFGIPIFMNFYLIIPFILVPIVNFFIAYLFLSYTNIIIFNDVFVPWTTPALLNIYLSTDGNIIAVGLQLFLIILGTFIYIPFIKRYSRTQSSTNSLEKFASKLDITASLDYKKNIRFQEAQSSLIKSHHKINNIIERINQENLMVYYQPKVDVKNKKCNDYEALLRIKGKDRVIRGPDFIIDIEDSGLASIIDMWVCKQVKKDLESWAQKGFYPSVSINMFPYTLEDKDFINEVIDILKGHKISFEIIERRSSLNEKVLENINLLKSNKFKISLDDLGVGFTNFSMLYEIPLDIVKIDRKIIAYTKTKKGLILYENICKLAVELDLEIVLEGIETQEEYDKLVNKDINLVQGWYYSKAICFDEVESYTRNFVSNN
ncbi:MAG: hypothetical protein C0625_01365 [Arcobacter sp.]|nr:MAG: hypothetical protein C0625_01365 [Arcobacter sp.]